MPIIKFNTMDFGTYETAVVISGINQTNTANNKPMLKITISDGSETITALKFDSTKADLAAGGIEEGSTAQVALEITDYKGSKSYRIVSVTPVKLPDEELKQLITLPPEDPDKLVKDILIMIKQSSGREYDLTNISVPDDDFSITALTVRLLTQYLKAFTKSSAAKAMHHNIYGGLGSAVAEAAAKTVPVPIEMVGTDDRFGQVGTEAFLRSEYRLNAAHIVESAKRAIERK